ncbi:radical SAM protein [Candidatus Woesearchaeota archaeon]|nr:radical SAM protein [Candidatus Woesearchaeota archaeon]
MTKMMANNNKVLELHLTNNCNNNCEFCSFGEKEDRDIDLKVLDEILSKEKINKIALSGGEPTISKKIFQVLEYLKNKRYSVGVATNGRMLSNDAFFNKLKDYNINHFYVSLLSYKRETHDKLTRTKNSFDQTMKGIKKLVKNNQKIIIDYVITKDNVKDLYETVKMIHDMSPKIMVKLRLVEPVGFAKKKISSLFPALRLLEEELSKIKSYSNKKNVKVLAIPLCLFNSKLINSDYDYIKQNLDDFSLFKLSDENIKKVKIKENFLKKVDFCASCRLRKRCVGIYTDVEDEFINFFKNKKLTKNDYEK